MHQRLNPARMSCANYLTTVAESNGNVFASTDAGTWIKFNDDTLQLLDAVHRVLSWAERKFSSVSEFIPSEELVAEPEPQRARGADEDDDEECV